MTLLGKGYLFSCYNTPSENIFIGKYEYIKTGTDVQ